MIQDSDEKVTHDTLNIPIEPNLVWQHEGVRLVKSARSFGGGYSEDYVCKYKTRLGIEIDVIVHNNDLDDREHPKYEYPYYAKVDLLNIKRYVFGMKDFEVLLEQISNVIDASAGMGFLWTN